MPSAIARRSAAVGNVKLLFRHDEYYPLDFETYGTTEGLLIGMRPDPRAYVFDPMQVHSYHFTISKEDSIKMEKERVGRTISLQRCSLTVNPMEL
jgi:hypothetical protein